MEAYLHMLTTIREAVAEEIAAGRSLTETVAARPTAAFDARYGVHGFVNPEQFAEAVYRSLSAQP